MSVDLSIEPHCSQWLPQVETYRRMNGALAGRTIAEWRATTRHELGLAVNRPIIATGHQTLLWHPGILAKYLATHVFAQQHDLATANLIVDQHADGFGSFDVPVRRADDTLATRRIELTTPRAGVPMGLHEPFEPAPLPGELRAALPDVDRGARRIRDAITDHRDAPNAARQMARALNDLMRPWVEPMPSVCASSLVTTTFGRTLLQAMCADPQSCARLYNKAVHAVPEAGVAPLLVRDDYVELPLWRIRNGQRARAYDSDVDAFLDGDDAVMLMPRALFMTALIRLVMCDTFVHGTGAAVYDRAMERWVHDWLGVTPAPKVIATADVYLPLHDAQHQAALPIDRALQRYRRLWHDPDAIDAAQPPSATKQHWLERIDEAPRRSLARRRAFFAMHESLDAQRHRHADAVLEAEQALRAAERAAQHRAIAARRDWPFPLYPTSQIDELADAIRRALTCPPRQLAHH